ncbi:MAG: CoA pyrophosphatase [Candidatus Eremiobacteraeota bacterium]|nr:CoA pyrophosphatase [Candidatus Eremiobacteraeota bacterium]
MGYSLPDTDLLHQRLKAHQPSSVDRNGRRQAGVLVPVVYRQGNYEVVFIRRSAHLRRHAGQIAFPGGVHEPEDADLLATALREGHEEVGLEPKSVTVLGQLDEVWTPTGYTLTPYVGLLDSTPDRPDRDEVEEILVVGVERLIQPGVFRFQEIQRDGISYRLVFFDLAECTIWGATGRVLQRFLEVGLGWSAPTDNEWESGPYA